MGDEQREPHGPQVVMVGSLQFPGFPCRNYRAVLTEPLGTIQSRGVGLLRELILSYYKKDRVRLWL
ncbi:hypothetical protein J6590_016477 [Homalodisca vitripennis]|nr:hypothetical protein J6590_016477 [Homalodisca vitripennis]